MKRVLIGAFLVLIAGTAIAGGSDEPAESNGVTEVESVIPVEIADFSEASAAGVTFAWKIEGETITVLMSAQTTGWVSVGFDPTRQMADANIIIGYVADGQVFLRDDFGIGNVRHGADTDNGGVDNLSAVEGSESDGVTTITFTIPLDSGDAMDTVLSAGGTHKVIVAYGPDGKDDFGSYHASRGSVEVTL